MIVELAAWLGPWSWLVLGLALLCLEIVIPGVFLLWFGLAAVVTGLLTLALWGSLFWSWQVQIIVFAALSVLSIMLGRDLMKRVNTKNDHPFLNRRAESLVGRVATLTEAIENGNGRIKLDDTTWSVSGPDLPEGAKVRIVAAEGRSLSVEPA